MWLCERLIHFQGSCPIGEYLQDVNAAADELSLIDNPVSNDDLTLYIINGLSNDFETILTAFQTRDTSISFEELYES